MKKLKLLRLLLLIRIIFTETTPIGVNGMDSSEDYEERSLNIDISSNEVGSRLLPTVEEEDIIFRYFNKKDSENGIRIYVENATGSLTEWKNNAQLKVITHGWLSSEQSNAVFAIKNAYLQTRDINVITVDWSKEASWKVYPVPAYLTEQVGLWIAKLLDNLIKAHLVTPDLLHIIGHSLGAHVSGATGSSMTAGKAARITGLDPAGPGFETIKFLDSVLDPNDASFVDVIHTAAGVAGFFSVLGHADFYPNGGKPQQPGCNELTSVSGVVRSFGCSHGRSYYYFVDSILHPHTFKAYRCDTWAEFKSGACSNSSTVYMGDETPPDTRGVYYLETKSESPFGGDN